MRLPRTIGRKPAKARSRKTTKPKRSIKSKAAHRTSSSVVDLQNQIKVLTGEIAEARAQQTATSEVLEIISRSSGDLGPVFATILENAVRICSASFGNIYRWDGETLRIAAAHNNTPPAFAEFRRRSPLRFGPDTPTGRMLATKAVVHVTDLKAERQFAERGPDRVAAVELGGARTLLLVPMLQENELIGAITLFHQDVRPFTDKQILPVTNFAAQAVIAIENARLLTELRESLEQQTATSEVLRVISSSPGELEAVFQAILENATRICEAKFGMLFLSEGDAFRTVAQYGAPPAWAEARRREPVVRPSAKNPLARVAAKKQLEHITDLRIDEGYVSGDPAFRALAEIAQARTLLVVPMLKDDALIGTISIYRQEVRPLHRQADRADTKLRCPSGHCHRERAPPHRTAPAHR